MGTKSSGTSSEDNQTHDSESDSSSSSSFIEDAVPDEESQDISPMSDTEMSSDDGLLLNNASDKEVTDMESAFSLPPPPKTLHSSEIPPCAPSLETQLCHLSYKIVGDNIDKTVRPRFMRMKQHRTQSLHFFHSYAIRDRIDTSGLLDVHPQTCLPSPRQLAESLLPQVEDDYTIMSNFSVLISRVLTEHLQFFKTSFSDVVQHYITHDYDREMSLKSEVVRMFGLLLTPYFLNHYTIFYWKLTVTNKV